MCFSSKGAPRARLRYLIHLLAILGDTPTNARTTGGKEKDRRMDIHALAAVLFATPTIRGEVFWPPAPFPAHHVQTASRVVQINPRGNEENSHKLLEVIFAVKERSEQQRQQ